MTQEHSRSALPWRFRNVLVRRYLYLTERRSLGNSYDLAEARALEWVISYFDDLETDHEKGQGDQAR